MGNAILMVLMIMNIQPDHIDYKLVHAEHTPMMQCLQEAMKSNMANVMKVGNVSVTCSPNINDPETIKHIELTQ